jgi:hypothetical protein
MEELRPEDLEGLVRELEEEYGMDESLPSALAGCLLPSVAQPAEGQTKQTGIRQRVSRIET